MWPKPPTTSKNSRSSAPVEAEWKWSEESLEEEIHRKGWRSTSTISIDTDGYLNNAAETIQERRKESLFVRKRAQRRFQTWKFGAGVFDSLAVGRRSYWPATMIQWCDFWKVLFGSWGCRVTFTALSHSSGLCWCILYHTGGHFFTCTLAEILARRGLTREFRSRKPPPRLAPQFGEH